MLHGTAPCFPPVFLLCPAPHSCSCLLGELCFPPQWTVSCSPCGWSGWAQSMAGTQGIKAWSPASKPGRHLPGCMPLTQPACSPELCSQLPGSLFRLSTGLRSADQEFNPQKERRKAAVFFGHRVGKMLSKPVPHVKITESNNQGAKSEEKKIRFI